MKKKTLLAIVVVIVISMVSVGSAFAHGGHGWRRGDGSCREGYHWGG
ncbi:MAG: hypothetical protein LBI74_00140 [Synergistaceae bacterium]|jgi:hypothetical protein|nr:hypothetical protein [Synergistaceae bacterium]